jgi:hypothetical protein
LALTPNGALTGVPTAAGSFSFGVQVADGTSGTPGTAVRNYTVDVAAPVISIATTFPERLFLGRAFSLPLQGAGGAQPYTFAVISGALPPGVTLSSAGEFAGTPGAVGSYTFGVRITDANGFTSTTSVTLGVFPPPIMVPAQSISGLLALVLTLLGFGFIALRSTRAGH